MRTGRGPLRGRGGGGRGVSIEVHQRTLLLMTLEDGAVVGFALEVVFLIFSFDRVAIAPLLCGEELEARVDPGLVAFAELRIAGQVLLAGRELFELAATLRDEHR